MKMIIAIIQPEKLEAVKQSLFNSEVCKMTVSRVRGYSEHYRGQVKQVNLLEKIRIEIAVNDDFVEPTIKAIIKAAKSGSIGDGKVFVMPLEKCIRIRTEENGEDAVG
jgi:nitrogen regulatory protein P-II 1